MAKQHELTLDHLRDIALSGRLNQLNRSPDCRDKLTLMAFCMSTALPFVYFNSIALGYLVLADYLDARNMPLESSSFGGLLEQIV